MWWGDLVLVAGVLALLAFPVAARVAADAQPVGPGTGVVLPPLQARGADPAIRALPVFLGLSSASVASLVAGGPAVERRAIEARIRALYGPNGVRRIGDAVSASFSSGTLRLPPLRSAQFAAANDLAALVIVADATHTFGWGNSGPAINFAGFIALALLQQAASGGGCAPELNLAFLRSADDGFPDDNLVERTYERAAAVCPGDPTPLWALAEFQSQRAAAGNSANDGGQPADLITRPFATLEQLQRDFPRVAAAWAGEGDAEMRLGYQLEDNEPFAARGRFTRARAYYQRAVVLQPNYENWAGMARAQAALGDYGAAIATQRRAAAAYPASADLQARLLDYLQRGQRFSDAAGVAAELMSNPTFPSGVELFAAPASDANVAAEDTAAPLSTGVGVMDPVDIMLAPPEPGGSGPGGSTVNDRSFFPDFRPMQGIGGSARWCPGWSRAVDLLLAGDYGASLTALPHALDDLRPDLGDCSSVRIRGPRDLAAIAELELDHVGTAERLVGPKRLSSLEDLRQNLWRYAGNLRHAAMAAAQWAARLPRDDLAVTREGEIAFLRGLYDQAAGYFAVVANRARVSYGYGSQEEARALLDQGTALISAGRRAEGLAALAQANTTATGWDGAFGRRSGNPAWPLQLSIYAMEQAGNALLDHGDARQATEDYGIAADTYALENQRLVGTTVIHLGPTSLRPEALANNQALADIATGDASAATTVAAEAVKIDPGDPIFWWTTAEAEQHLGQRTRAISDYRTSLALDPTEFPVANNLGVLLMERGDNAAAAAALRRSVGANRDYATGWFNLGVALERMGLLHLAASEGSLARARQLDPKLASRGPVPLFDNVTYQSHLDLSKPLPAHWSFASSQTHASVAAAGLSAILVIALGLARSLGARATPAGAQKWFDVIAALDKNAPSVAILRAPALGVTATVAFLLWPLHAGPTDGWFATGAFAIGLCILIAVVIRVRQLAATRSRLALRQETWPPGVAFGLVVTLAGAGWAPLPVARAPGAATGVHWAGPTAVAALAIVLLILATAFNVGLTRSLGAAGLVMAASLLTPVAPIDGATVSTTAVGALPSLAVLGAAVLMLAGLL
jgi:tetratricopeptide (TPR) repeat protein